MVYFSVLQHVMWLAPFGCGFLRLWGNAFCFSSPNTFSKKQCSLRSSTAAVICTIMSIAGRLTWCLLKQSRVMRFRRLRRTARRLPFFATMTPRRGVAERLIAYRTRTLPSLRMKRPFLKTLEYCSVLRRRALRGNFSPEITA